MPAASYGTASMLDLMCSRVSQGGRPWKQYENSSSLTLSQSSSYAPETLQTAGAASCAILPKLHSWLFCISLRIWMCVIEIQRVSARFTLSSVHTIAPTQVLADPSRLSVVTRTLWLLTLIKGFLYYGVQYMVGTEAPPHLRLIPGSQDRPG